MKNRERTENEKEELDRLLRSLFTLLVKYEQGEIDTEECYMQLLGMIKPEDLEAVHNLSSSYH